MHTVIESTEFGARNIALAFAALALALTGYLLG